MKKNADIKALLEFRSDYEQEKIKLSVKKKN